ncbi:hypothetical protein ES332_D09G049300v1 [Gossypium tomentosum]|uniref:Uncharacterized protein n=1 Tax=Gossypium tomentosum TaxID=34277 RepID=A0A5D2JCU5_GOSTO|nr:hypothetical protein ES332_D09G049300v1 [Gossypium tomentosum]
MVTQAFETESIVHQPFKRPIISQKSNLSSLNLCENHEFIGQTNSHKVRTQTFPSIYHHRHFSYCNSPILPPHVEPPPSSIRGFHIFALLVPSHVLFCWLPLCLVCVLWLTHLPQHIYPGIPFPLP